MKAKVNLLLTLSIILIILFVNIYWFLSGIYDSEYGKYISLFNSLSITLLLILHYLSIKNNKSGK